MAKDLSTATRIGTDADYINGDLIDETTGTPGTLLDTTVLQDVIQFFQKTLAKAGIAPNGDFDNEANGYQLLQAVDERNDVAKARTFEFNHRVDALAVGATETINFPYSYSFDSGKFNGLVSYTATGGNIDNIVATGGLVAGTSIFTDTEIEVRAFTNKLEIENIGATGTTFVNLSLIIFGHVD